MSLSQVLSDPTPMLTAIHAELARLGLPEFPCDHICYRVETFARYEECKAQLATLGALAAETTIAGRPIAIFHLHEPFQFHGRAIECVELPAPKANSPYREGWEHAEFVTGKPLAALLARFAELNFDTRALGKPINPEVALPIPPSFQAKFHQCSILEVIELERKLGINS